MECVVQSKSQSAPARWHCLFAVFSGHSYSAKGLGFRALLESLVPLNQNTLIRSSYHTDLKHGLHHWATPHVGLILGLFTDGIVGFLAEMSCPKRVGHTLQHYAGVPEHRSWENPPNNLVNSSDLDDHQRSRGLCWMLLLAGTDQRLKEGPWIFAQQIEVEINSRRPRTRNSALNR